MITITKNDNNNKKGKKKGVSGKGGGVQKKRKTFIPIYAYSNLCRQHKTFQTNFSAHRHQFQFMPSVSKTIYQCLCSPLFMLIDDDCIKNYRPVFVLLAIMYANVC